MPNLVDVTYAQTGQSVSTDDLGMREMQAMAFAKRDSRYLLLKAPPASGKSRALMFLGLDKLYNQGKSKVVVAVPERSIGASFASTKLTDHGFFADWDIRPENNLCTPGGEASKVSAVERFFASDASTLVCTHATLRFASDVISDEAWNGTVLAIDEFHHVSADDSSKLGEVLRSIMANTDAHIIAMTGSYFRGDAVPVLDPGDEARFTKVTYNYYQQLNGYEHMKSLGIGYHFYQGRYTDAIHEILDTDKKTIIHIPSVNSGESTKDKYQEVDRILDAIGTVVGQDDDTGVISVRRADGRILKVADLVMDEQAQRDKIVGYLRNIETPNDMDLIIALGMAKEGFDWTFCEHALTVGYRGSLTEVIQIIGRATRDSPGKAHAQFTNLIAQPEADDDEVKLAVNNMLKAITASLLMEQVLAPNFKFRTKRPDDPDSDNGGNTGSPGTLSIKGFKEPTSARVQQIIDDDINDLKARIMQNPKMLKAMPGNIDPEVANKILIPQVIREAYPDLDEAQVEQVRQHVVVDSVVKNGQVKEVDGKKFLLMANKFVNIDDIDVNLIDKVNPFQEAFEILSKSVTAQVLKVIQDQIDATRVEISDEEARLLWPKINQWAKVNGRKPDLRADDPLERRMAEALVVLRKQRKQQGL